MNIRMQSIKRFHAIDDMINNAIELGEPECHNRQARVSRIVFHQKNIDLAGQGE